MTIKHWLPATAALTLALLFNGNSASAGELIIVIDDVGNNRALGEQAVSLPAPVNLAFLPETPYAKRLAEQAWQQGHNVMLHAPMANTAGVPLGAGGLYPDMTEQQFKQTLNHTLDVIPHVSGFNNHMGSLLTQDCEKMRWAMEVAQQRQLFFVDSRTIANSCAARQAKAAGIAVLSRDVFLDNDRSYQALEAQFNKAVAIAEKRGRAILIGHPYKESMAYLHAKLSGEISITQTEAAPVEHNHELPAPAALSKPEASTRNHIQPAIQKTSHPQTRQQTVTLAPLPADLTLKKLDTLLPFDAQRVQLAQQTRAKAIELEQAKQRRKAQAKTRQAIAKLKAQGGGLLLAQHQSEDNKRSANTSMLTVELPNGEQKNLTLIP